MAVTDAEREFYEEVLQDTSGKSINDLRYAYFLAALDGGLPSGVPEFLATVDGYDAEVAQTLQHDDTGALLWVTNA